MRSVTFAVLFGLALGVRAAEPPAGLPAVEARFPDFSVNPEGLSELTTRAADKEAAITAKMTELNQARAALRPQIAAARQKLRKQLEELEPVADDPRARERMADALTATRQEIDSLHAKLDQQYHDLADCVSDQLLKRPGRGGPDGPAYEMRRMDDLRRPLQPVIDWLRLEDDEENPRDRPVTRLIELHATLLVTEGDVPRRLARAAAALKRAGGPRQSKDVKLPDDYAELKAAIAASRREWEGTTRKLLEARARYNTCWHDNVRRALTHNLASLSNEKKLRRQQQIELWDREFRRTRKLIPGAPRPLAPPNVR